ncbi:MAG: alpha/beta fold hydrolase [Ectothiorhodospiraceae bacterium]|jgi:pimeloyl-ACP methyl ester carboxylesterase/DNA-binding CsgD family transcriptional regulator
MADSPSADTAPDTQTIRFCTNGYGNRIAYATLGNGPVLIKAANWLTHIEHDLASPVWGPFLRRLAANHTLVRYDECGCGLSDREVTESSLDAWVNDLEAVVEASGVNRFGLLGISQGGAVAVAYAARHPERVSHLILHGAYVRGRLAREPSVRASREAMLFRTLIELGWGTDTPAFRQVFTTLFVPDATPEQARAFSDLQRLSSSPENAARIVDTCDHIDVSDLARRIRVPTLVFHSRGDARIPFEEGRLLAGLIPRAEFVPLESNNHAILEKEAAWDRFFETVEAFLSHSGEPGASGPPGWLGELTSRERAVLELVAAGHDNATIADGLGIRAKTVRNHLTTIFDKLGVSNRGRAIVLAREAGFGRQ